MPAIQEHNSTYIERLKTPCQRYSFHSSLFTRWCIIFWPSAFENFMRQREQKVKQISNCTAYLELNTFKSKMFFFTENEYFSENHFVRTKWILFKRANFFQPKSVRKFFILPCLASTSTHLQLWLRLVLFLDSSSHPDRKSILTPLRYQ